MIRFGRAAFAGYGAIGCFALLLVPIIVIWALVSEEPPDPLPTNRSMIIRQQDVKTWPYRVPAVRINCGDGYAIWAEADGVAVGLTRYTFGKPETYAGTARAGEGSELNIPGRTVSDWEVARVARDRCAAAGKVPL